MARFRWFGLTTNFQRNNFTFADEEPFCDAVSAFRRRRVSTRRARRQG